MYKIYQIEENETLDSIANKLGTSKDTLKEINGIIGEVLLIPGSFLIVPMIDDRYKTYIVKEGDTIYSISKKYNVEPNMVLQLNGLEEDDYIYPNQNIKIPNNNYQFYVTKPGDNVIELEQNLNKDINELLKLNDNIYLEPNQMIIYK